MNKKSEKLNDYKADRRKLLELATSLGVVAALSPLSGILKSVHAGTISKTKTMLPKAFVYTELQISVAFDQAPWEELNAAISVQPGFINKTWLSGVGNHSVGGFYAFDSIQNAQKYVTGYFPNEARKLGAAQTTRVFDASVTEEASRGVKSVHYGAKAVQKPGAFVYTEVQINVPFEKAPWRKRNPFLIQQQGLLYKTWLSGFHTNTLGGIDAFDTLENATAFALNDFPRVAKKMNSAFYTRIFDANITEQASRQMRSPFYS